MQQKNTTNSSSSNHHNYSSHQPPTTSLATKPNQLLQAKKRHQQVQQVQQMLKNENSFVAATNSIINNNVTNNVNNSHSNNNTNFVKGVVSTSSSNQNIMQHQNHITTTNGSTTTANQTSNISTNNNYEQSSNASGMMMNIKCSLCERDLDGSFRIMKHAICGLRYCAHHLQEVLNSPHHSTCPRCDKKIRKEDLVCTPSLSASARDTSSAWSTNKGVNASVGSQPQYRNKLMPTPSSESDTAYLYDCPICNLGGLTHGQLLDHSKQHANIPGKCPICFKKGIDYHSKHLYGHLMLRHKDSVPVQGSSGKAQQQNQQQISGGNANNTLAVNNHSNMMSMSQTMNSTTNHYHRSQVQSTNQTQLQASKGIQQSQQQRQPGGALPKALSKMSSVNLSNSRSNALYNPSNTMKERRNTTNLSAMAASNYQGSNSSAANSTKVSQSQQAQSLLSIMLSQMQQQNQNQSMTTPSASQSVNTTQLSRGGGGGKKNLSSHRSNMQAHSSQAQFGPASTSNKRGPSGGAKTPQISSLGNSHGAKNGKMMKLGLTTNSCNNVLINAGGQKSTQNIAHGSSSSALQHMMQSQVLKNSSQEQQNTISQYMRRGMSARGDQSRSQHMMFNRDTVGGVQSSVNPQQKYLIAEKYSQCLSQGLLGVYTFSIVRTKVVDTSSPQDSKSPQKEESKQLQTASQKFIRKLQLSSQYLATQHKFSLIKRQSPTGAFKLTDLEKFLARAGDSVVQDHKLQSGDGGGEISDYTDDGASSTSSFTPDKDADSRIDQQQPDVDDEIMISSGKSQPRLHEQPSSSSAADLQLKHQSPQIDSTPSATGQHTIRSKQQTTAHKGKSGTQQFKTKAGYMQQPQFNKSNSFNQQLKRNKQQPGRMSIDASRQRQVQQSESDFSMVVAKNSQKLQRRRASHQVRKAGGTRSSAAISPQQRQVPLYLQEIEKICFPDQMPSERNVLLQKDTKRFMTFVNHEKLLSPDLLKLQHQHQYQQQNTAQMPHKQNYFSQRSQKLLSVSPHTATVASNSNAWRSQASGPALSASLQQLRPQQMHNPPTTQSMLNVGTGAAAPSIASGVSALADMERHKSLPRFNSSVNTPQMMLVQKGVSPKGHHGTKKLQELNINNRAEGDDDDHEGPMDDDDVDEGDEADYNSIAAARSQQYCRLEDFESFHRKIFYSTRTADDKVQYLSILVCAEPHIVENDEINQSQNGGVSSGRDLSDAIISDEDVESERSRNVIKATLQPYVLVIVTSRPVFESAMGSQMLDLIYQKCFLPLYRKICFPSQLLNRHFQSCQQYTSDINIIRKMLIQHIDLEVVISMLFDLLNIFCMSKEDSFRRISWKDPSVVNFEGGPTRSLQQVNQIFLANQNFFFDGNFSFKMLFKLIQVDDLIKLFSCMLLEKKIVLLGDNTLYQEQFAPLIEAILKLYYPLDSQVYTNVSYTLSQDMVYYMEKPGSLIMGMPKHLWISHGQRVFNESFDTHIVVYDIQERVFHLKTPDQPIGLPRTFSKLLRRSISAIDQTMSNAYVSFQLRQAVFNTLLLMISFMKSKEAKKASKRFQAQMAGNSNDGQEDNDSANSVQTVRDGKNQYPYSRDFFQEFKLTTAFIDLSDKLEKKESSVAFITDCLAIIEQQKIDWFIKLLEFQVSFMASDMNHIVKLFYPQANQRVEDPFKQLDFEEVVAIHQQEQPSKTQQKKTSPSRRQKKEADSQSAKIESFNYTIMKDIFKIQRHLVSKMLRFKLHELKSFSYTQHNNEASDAACSASTTPGKLVINRSLKSRGGIGPSMVGSQEQLLSKNEIQFATLTRKHAIGIRSLIADEIQPDSANIINAGNSDKPGHLESSQLLAQRFPLKNHDQDTPQQYESSQINAASGTQSTPCEQKAPKTPDDTVQKAFSLVNEESEVPPSSTRAARYGSTHKPQISFQQVRSSDSPPSAALPPENTPKVDESPPIKQKTSQNEEKKEEKANVLSQSAGGFFSIFTNFFSSNKSPAEEETKAKEEQAKKDQKLSLQEEFNFQAGRKASKSMQVVQPQFMNFHRPIDMQAVAQIKTLSSGLSILKNHMNDQSTTTHHVHHQPQHRKQKSSMINDHRQNNQHQSLGQSQNIQRNSIGINSHQAQHQSYNFSQIQQQRNQQSKNHQHHHKEEDSVSTQKQSYHQPQTGGPHMRQETATFVKEASASKHSLYNSGSISKREETAQFATSSPQKTSLMDLTEKQQHKFTIKNYHHHQHHQHNTSSSDHQTFQQSNHFKPFATNEQLQHQNNNNLNVVNNNILNCNSNSTNQNRLSMETQKVPSQRHSIESSSQQQQNHQLQINRFQEALSQVESRGGLVVNNHLRPSAIVPESMDVMPDDNQIQLVPVEDMEEDSGTAMQTFANEEGGVPDPLNNAHPSGIAQRPRGNYERNNGDKVAAMEPPLSNNVEQQYHDGRNSVPLEPICYSARCSNDSRGAGGIGAISQENRIRAPSYINSQRNPISASNGKQRAVKDAIVDVTMEQQYASRPFFPAGYSSQQQKQLQSPKKFNHQQSNEQQKRFSLNAIGHTAVSSKQSVSTSNHQHMQKNYASEQISATNSNSNNKFNHHHYHQNQHNQMQLPTAMSKDLSHSQMSNSNNVVRTTTITLKQSNLSMMPPNSNSQ